jgi:hypothetical protein
MAPEKNPFSLTDLWLDTGLIWLYGFDQESSW